MHKNAKHAIDFQMNEATALVLISDSMKETEL
jgi:hypothetical protein